ncbi:MAG: MBL fold metallo-hydrolase [Acidobacteria bacterium]|nr:MBL fold metallo-hydrolase [Acidobacteriota bacterium]
MEQIAPGLCWIDDTCSVYALAHAGETLLIDCGTRLAPGSEIAAGLGRVNRVLLTHFHRDQCSSAAAWRDAGAAVTVPFAEKRFFEEADLLRASYDIYDNYTSYYPAFGSLRDIQPSGYAHDYERLEWRGFSIDVVPLPGHTFGSAGYLFEVAGQRVLACGDLLSAPDRIHEYFPAQWKYMDFQGHAHLLESLRAVDSMELDWILPGHGAPFRATPGALAPLRARLERIWELFHGSPYEYFRPRLRELTPHVWEVSNSVANTYIVRNDRGGAVLIDCGYVSNAPVAANPHRFIDNLTPYLQRELGVERVEWFLPTHYHDDHLAGYAALRARYGTKVACSPELRDILEHPERFEMPCTVERAIPIDATVNRGEAFEWSGFRFHIEQQPGQTLYHHLIRLEADGKVFLSVGDNISGVSFREKRDFVYSFIPKNRTPVSSYGDMPRQILAHSPDFLLTGHGGAVVCDRAAVERWRAWMDEWQGCFEAIIDRPEASMGMDRQWVEFYPYRVRVRPGSRVRFTVKVTNHEAVPRACRLEFRSVAGVTIAPDCAESDVPAKAVWQCDLEVSFPAVFSTHSLPVLADVTWNGRHLGEIAEAIAYW